VVISERAVAVSQSLLLASAVSDAEGVDGARGVAAAAQAAGVPLSPTGTRDGGGLGGVRVESGSS